MNLCVDLNNFLRFTPYCILIIYYCLFPHVNFFNKRKLTTNLNKLINRLTKSEEVDWNWFIVNNRCVLCLNAIDTTYFYDYSNSLRLSNILHMPKKVARLCSSFARYIGVSNSEQLFNYWTLTLFPFRWLFWIQLKIGGLLLKCLLKLDCSSRDIYSAETVLQTTALILLCRQRICIFLSGEE